MTNSNYRNCTGCEKDFETFQTLSPSKIILPSFPALLFLYPINLILPSSKPTKLQPLLASNRLPAYGEKKKKYSAISKQNSVSLKISIPLPSSFLSFVISLTKYAGRKTGRVVFSPPSIALIVVFPQRIIPLQLGELLVPDVATFTAYNCREDAALRSAQLFGDKCPPKRKPS